MLSGIYFICVVFVVETATVLFWFKMNDSRESNLEFVKERLEEETVAASGDRRISPGLGSHKLVKRQLT